MITGEIKIALTVYGIPSGQEVPLAKYIDNIHSVITPNIA